MPMSFTAKEHFDETLERARETPDQARFHELMSYCEGMLAATRIQMFEAFSQQECELYRSRLRAVKYRRQLERSHIGFANSQPFNQQDYSRATR